MSECLPALNGDTRNGMPTVFVVDDDPDVVTGLSRLLGVQGYRVRAYRSGNAFLNEHDPSVVGCVLIDFRLPDLSGLEVQAHLLRAAYRRPVVFLSGTADVPTSVQAMKDGAIDFLVKPISADQLFPAIARAIARDIEQRRASADRAAFEAMLQTLTPREREVLPHLVTGRINKQIAGDFGVTEKTIKAHRAHIKAKLQARSVADLVRFMSKLEQLRTAL